MHGKATVNGRRKRMSTIQNFIKKLAGVDKIEAELEQLRIEKEQAEKLAAEKMQESILIEQRMLEEKRIREEEEQARAEQEAIAKKSPKDIATERGEAWVSVLDTKVNPENPRNGFFELDWNDFFIVQLKQAGYGYDGDPDEEIVDRWFRDLARNMLVEEGQDPSRGAGFINVIPISQGKSEVS